MGSLGDSNFNGSGKLFAGTLETFGETSFFLTAGAAGFGFGRAGVFRADLGLKTGLGARLVLEGAAGRILGGRLKA